MGRWLIVYHGNCYDGFSAAWVLHRALGGDAELYPARYGEPPPDVQGRDVYVVDFSWPREEMLAVSRAARELLVLDHHKTAQEACAGLDFCLFDMGRSGCRMAWDHCHPEEPPPSWLLHVEDRDLWKFAQPHTKEVHAHVASLPMTLEAWDELHATPIEDVVESGRAVSRYIDRDVEKASQEARVIDFCDHRVVAVNVPYQNASEMGSYLIGQHPDADFAMGWFQRADGRFQFSLRSRSGFDVSEVAKRFGGGGHAGAAGFELTNLPAPLTW